MKNPTGQWRDGGDQLATFAKLMGMNIEKIPLSRMGASANTPRVDEGLVNASPQLESRVPARKPTNVGCVFGRYHLKVGELSPEAYAALLEEL